MNTRREFLWNSVMMAAACGMPGALAAAMKYDRDGVLRLFRLMAEEIDARVEAGIELNRKGPMRSQLMLQKGRRHQCIYQTIAGDLNIGVFTKTLNNNRTEKGGSLEVSYTLDFNTDLVSENRFLITIEEKQNTVR